MKALGWVIAPGKMAPCEHCARVKAKQKNVVKSSVSETKATKPGEQIYLYLSKVTAAGDNDVEELNRKHRKLIVDEHTGKKLSKFSKAKVGWSIQSCKWLNKMKARGIPKYQVDSNVSRGREHQVGKVVQVTIVAGATAH